MPEPQFEVEGEVILTPVDKLIETFLNRLRDWHPTPPDHPSSTVCLRGFIAIAKNVFRTLRFICSDKARKEDPFHKIEYTKTAPHLARVILEILFNTAFMLDDLSTRVELFEKAGWAAQRDDIAKIEAEFGKDPAWKDTIETRKDLLAKGVRQFCIRPDELSGAVEISRWPLPSAMRSRKDVAPALVDYFRYLDTWFYGQFSEDIHVKGPGFMRALAGLPDMKVGDVDLDPTLHRIAMGTTGIAAALVLAILSEIQLVARLDGNTSARLKEAWVLVTKVSTPTIESVYKKRYADAL